MTQSYTIHRARRKVNARSRLPPKENAFFRSEAKQTCSVARVRSRMLSQRNETKEEALFKIRSGNDRADGKVAGQHASQSARFAEVADDERKLVVRA